MKLVAIIWDGKICETLDPKDNCGGYAAYGGHCGGCGNCLLMQAVHYGYKLVDIDLQEGETESDAVTRALRERGKQ